MGEIDQTKKDSWTMGNLLRSLGSAGSVGGGIPVAPISFQSFMDLRTGRTDAYVDLGTMNRSVSDVVEDIKTGGERGFKFAVSDITGLASDLTGNEDLDRFTEEMRASLPEGDYRNHLLGGAVEEITRAGGAVAAGTVGTIALGKAGVPFLGLMAFEALVGGAAGFVRDPRDPSTVDFFREIGLLEDEETLALVQGQFQESVMSGESRADFEERLINAGVDAAMVATLSPIFHFGTRVFSGAARSSSRAPAFSGSVDYNGAPHDIDVDFPPTNDAIRSAQLPDTVAVSSPKDVVQQGTSVSFIDDKGRILSAKDPEAINSHEGLAMELKHNSLIDAVGAGNIRLSVISEGAVRPTISVEIMGPITKKQAEQIRRLAKNNPDHLFLADMVDPASYEQSKLLGIPIDEAAPLQRVSFDSFEALERQWEIKEVVERTKPPTSDFNYTRIEATDDVVALMQETEQYYAARLKDVTGGVQSHRLTAELAAQLDMKVEDLLNVERGTTFNAAQMLAARDILVGSAQELERLARLARSGNVEAKLEFRKHFTRHAQLQMNIKGVQTEIARSLNQFNIPAGSDARVFDEVMRSYGGSNTIDDLATRYLELNGEERARFVRQAWKATASDMILEYWINSLLSGVRTHVTNITSNSVFLATQPVERLIGSVTSGGAIHPREAGHMMLGMVEGFMDGLRLGARAFAEDAPQSFTSKLEGANRRSITSDNFGLNSESVSGRAIDYLGTVVRLPGRALMAEDEFFKAIAFRGELRALASREYGRILSEGGDKNAATRAYDMVMRGEGTAGEAAMTAASKQARVITFTDNLGATGQSIQMLANSHPIAKLIMPFVRTPVNIAKETLKRTPFAPVLQEVRDELAKGGVDRAMALSKISFGSMLGATLTTSYAQGRFTGSGPSDPREMAAMRETGWQPYSFVYTKSDLDPAQYAQLKEMGLVSEGADKVYISYQRLEPIGTLLGMAADAAEVMKYGDDIDIAEISTALVGGMFKSLGDKTFMQGVTLFAQAWSDSDRFLSSYARRLVGSFVPTIVADVARLNDPALPDIRREPDETFSESAFRQTLDTIKSRIPGLSDSVPKRVNFWGDEINLGQGEWYEVISPFFVSEGKGTKLEDEILRLGLPLSMPDRQLEGVPLSTEQYRRLIELQSKEIFDENGNTLRQNLEELISLPDYDILSIDDQVSLIRGVHRKYLGSVDTPGSARFQLMLEYPELQEQINTARELKSLGIQP